MRVLLLAAQVSGCTGTLDAGRDRAHRGLDVDSRNPIVLCNDGPMDNWQGEFAVLLSNFDGPKVVGLIVNESPAWPNLSDNVDGWKDLSSAAQASGLTALPEPTPSSSAFKVRPSDGRIDSTQVTASPGAELIVSAARQYAQPSRPLVVVTGTRLTDLADAYLLDRAVAERIVVVASIGTLTETGAQMGSPNGEMDYWADVIVASRLNYIQVSRFYDQTEDVTDPDVSRLPANAFGAWMAAKQPNLLETEVAADQVALLSVAAPSYVTKLDTVVPRYEDGGKLALPPPLDYGSGSSASVVTETDPKLSRQLLWQMLEAL